MKAFNRKKFKSGRSKEFIKFCKGGFAMSMQYSKHKSLAKYKRRGTGIGMPPKVSRYNFPCIIKATADNPIN